MRDLKRYWGEVREIRAGLPEFVWVVEADGSGLPVEVGSGVAARLLQAKSHRLATEDEVQSKNARDTESNRQRAQDLLRREGVAIVTI
jgi:hypothetical protein